jgi:hypothetical protein
VKKNQQTAMKQQKMIHATRAPLGLSDAPPEAGAGL